jgi:hypothetical protein
MLNVINGFYRRAGRITFKGEAQQDAPARGRPAASRARSRTSRYSAA